MMTPMRTIIDIPDQLVESLDRVGKTHQKSRAALVREAITDFLREKSIPQAEAAFGLWKQRNLDGVAYQNDLRQEWERQ
jgi:metal-responsive CopG/Arc/MetJ family transcriptional regulator